MMDQREARFYWGKATGIIGVLSILVSTLLLTLTGLPKAFAAPTSLATHVEIEMFALNADGSKTNNYCSYGNMSYGCTAFAGNSAYSYTHSTSTPTIAIEGDYLPDVLAQEMSPDVYAEPEALHAQAITSRSLVNYYINNPPELGDPVGDPFNNSNTYQVFIPYQYETLTEQGQALADDALASGEYIAYAVDNPEALAAKALFAADALAHTAGGTNDKDYFVGVPEPISTACDANDAAAHQWGMSQEGANRWARGHQCSYPGAGNGDSWSVQWEHVEYILTHYYTKIHLHDSDGERLTPNYRWVPLAIDWHTFENEVPDFIYGERYSITVAIQNTGVYPWIDSGQFALHALWLTPGPEELAAPQSVVAEANLFRITQPVTPGGALSATFTLRPPWPSSDSADYVLRFTMRLEDDDWVDFGDLEAELPWPGYDVAVGVFRPAAGPLFLPLIVGGNNEEPPTRLSRP